MTDVNTDQSRNRVGPCGRSVICLRPSAADPPRLKHSTSKPFNLPSRSITFTIVIRVSRSAKLLSRPPDRSMRAVSYVAASASTDTLPSVREIEKLRFYD